MVGVHKNEYCDFELSQKLNALGYETESDRVYCKTTEVSDRIHEEYPGLSDDGYYELTKEGGGELEWEDVYETKFRFMSYVYRDLDYFYAPRYVTVVHWLESEHDMKFKMDPIDSSYAQYTASVEYKGIVFSCGMRKFFSIFEVIKFFVEKGVEILEDNLQNKK